jgi:hypothetical protein
MTRLKYSNTKPRVAANETAITELMMTDPTFNCHVDQSTAVSEHCRLIEPAFSERVSTVAPDNFWAEAEYLKRDFGKSIRNIEYYYVGSRTKWFVSVTSPWMYLILFDYHPGCASPIDSYQIFFSQPVTNILIEQRTPDACCIAVRYYVF